MRAVRGGWFLERFDGVPASIEEKLAPVREIFPLENVGAASESAAEDVDDHAERRESRGKDRA
jgi:hypothetical protein